MTGLGRYPAPWRVVDLEVGAGVPPIEGCEDYCAVRALIRSDGQPLGWLTLPVSGPVIEPRVVEGTLQRELTGACHYHVVHRTLGLLSPSNCPPISVIVCTRDRPALLARCLEALGALDYRTFEIVVVDNAPTSDASDRVVRAAGVRYVREDAPGLDRARNRGLAEARYDIVAYTDDDAIVDRGWLQAISDAFIDPDVRGVTGLVVPAALDTEAELLFECGYGGMGKGPHAMLWDAHTLGPSGVLGAHHLGVGANMAFRRELLVEMGGFDPGLDVGTPARGGGDLDAFHRALVAGAVIRYEPRAIVRHSHRRDMAALRRQHADNGCAFGVYLLTIFARGAIPRHATAWYALRVWIAWLVFRVVKRAVGSEPLPMRLLLAELGGAVVAPLAWLRARRAARRGSPRPRIALESSR